MDRRRERGLGAWWLINRVLHLKGMMTWPVNLLLLPGLGVLKTFVKSPASPPSRECWVSQE